MDRYCLQARDCDDEALTAVLVHSMNDDDETEHPVCAVEWLRRNVATEFATQGLSKFAVCARDPPAASEVRAGVRPGSSALTLDADQRRAGLGYDVDMAKAADDLRAEVLALPAQERARIASDLWSVETQRRAAMLESGDVGTLTWDDIEQRFAERRAQRGA